MLSDEHNLGTCLSWLQGRHSPDCRLTFRPGNALEQVTHMGTSSAVKCSWNFCILDWTEGWSNNRSCDCWSLFPCLSLNNLASLCSGVSEANLSLCRALDLSNLASLCCSVSAASLSLYLVRFLCSLASLRSSLSASLLAQSLCSLASLCSSLFVCLLAWSLCSLATLCSSLSASLLAQSLSLLFLNRCSLSAAISEARRALSLSLLRWSLLSLDSSMWGRLEAEVELESISPPFDTELSIEVIDVWYKVS